MNKNRLKYLVFIIPAAVIIYFYVLGSQRTILHLNPVPAQSIHQGDSFPPLNLNEYVQSGSKVEDKIIWEVRPNNKFRISFTSPGSVMIKPADKCWTGIDTVFFEISGENIYTQTVPVIFKVIPFEKKPDKSSFRTIQIYQGERFPPVELGGYSSAAGSSKDRIRWIAGNGKYIEAIISRSNKVRIKTKEHGWTGEDSILFSVYLNGCRIDSGYKCFKVMKVSDPPRIALDSAIRLKRGQISFNINLSDHVFDLHYKPNEISWRHSDSKDFRIIIDGQKRAEFFVNTKDWSGRDTVYFTAANPAGISSRAAVVILREAPKAKPLIARIPDQKIILGESFLPVNLNHFISNHAELFGDIEWNVLGAKALNYNINDNNTVSISARNKDWIGSDTVIFKATVDGETGTSEPVKFSVLKPDKPVSIQKIQNQTIFSGEEFRAFKLKGNAANLRWNIEGNGYLRAFIDSSQTASIRPVNQNWTGSDTLTFTAEAPGYISGSNTAVFSVINKSFWQTQPVKPVMNVLMTGANDIFSVVLSPLDWNSNSFFIFPPVVLGAYFLMITDSPVQSWIGKDGTNKETPLMQFGTFYGKPTTTQISALSLSVFGLATGNDDITRLGLEIYESYFIANSVTSVLKRTFGRARPYEEQGPYDFIPFRSRPNPLNSFPSGHSTLAFSLSSVIAARTDNIWLKALIFTPAVITAYSRVYHNVHWFSDVFVGSAVGYLVGNYIVGRHNRINKDRIHMGIDSYGRFSISFDF